MIVKLMEGSSFIVIPDIYTSQRPTVLFATDEVTYFTLPPQGESEYLLGALVLWQEGHTQDIGKVLRSGSVSTINQPWATMVLLETLPIMYDRYSQYQQEGKNQFGFLRNRQVACQTLSASWAIHIVAGAEATRKKQHLCFGQCRHINKEYTINPFILYDVYCHSLQIHVEI
jgi:hypothetical protein